MSPRVVIRRISDLIFDLLSRFDLRGGEVAVGLGTAAYGLGAIHDAVTGACSWWVVFVAVPAGVAIQLAAYRMRWEARSVALLVAVAFWAWKAFDYEDIYQVRAQCLFYAVALTAALACIRAGMGQERRR